VVKAGCAAIAAAGSAIATTATDAHRIKRLISISLLRGLEGQRSALPDVPGNNAVFRSVWQNDGMTVGATEPVETPSLRGERRDALFRETLADIARRWLLGTAWALRPVRIGALPDLLGAMARDWLRRPRDLPNAARAPSSGIAGIVHDLTLPTLLEAYRRGLYPLAHAGPLKWWSPPLRSVLFFDEFHMSNNLRRLMRQGRYTVTFDRDFEQVIKSCAGQREGRWHLTWITPRIMRVYAEAFDAGQAHSFEVWNRDGELVAGGYGVAIGSAFTFESQFAYESNASKLGMSVLNWHLAKWGYRFNDGKLIGPLWHSVGFREIPRGEFLVRLSEAVHLPGKTGRWQIEADPAAVSKWQPSVAERAYAGEPANSSSRNAVTNGCIADV
jgi:leucyl/phenylalanyl-tRNA---protein transferase